MERGTDWERAAVRQRWSEIERRRRAAEQLRGGAVLVAAGVVALILAVSTTACITQVPWPGGCTTIVPMVTESVLLATGAVALAVGVWRCRRAFRQ